jgi:uncharacterized protein
MLQRYISTRVEEILSQNRIPVLRGVKRVGKTQILKEITQKHGQQGRYFNCDESSDRRTLQNRNQQQLLDSLSECACIAFDNAHLIYTIIDTIKHIKEIYPDVQLLLSSSTAFDFASQQYADFVDSYFVDCTMHALSLSEIQHSGVSEAEISVQYEHYMIFGLMPEVYGLPAADASEELTDYAINYVFKDITLTENPRSMDLLEHILLYLANKLGHEVSYREIGKKLDVSAPTIKTHMKLLERYGIIVQVPSFFTTKYQSSEIMNARKVYFCDTGVRNGLIGNYKPLHERRDAKALWENMCIMELIKSLSKQNQSYSAYFWRTKVTFDKVDFILDFDQALHAYQLQWDLAQETLFPADFIKRYKHCERKIINPSNIQDIVL